MSEDGRSADGAGGFEPPDASDAGTVFEPPDASDAETALTAARTLRGDDRLGPLVAEHGPLALDPADDPFERLVVSILGQQVSTDAAAAIRERLFDAVAVTPEGVAAADPETLREAGLSEQKTRYVRAAARAFRDEPERYDRASLAAASNDGVRERLTAITGVGRWTADMQLLFTLGRPDVFPVGDLGIGRGVQRLFDADLSRTEIRERGRRWAPYRSYASLYLWARED